jgi:hypothetical protein
MAVAAVRLAVREEAVRPTLVAADRRPYRCGGSRPDTDGRRRECNRRVGDIEGADTLLVTCERCGQEHAFALRTKRERALEAQITALLALLAYVSYDDGAVP